ncbi:MAG: uroporphyrinogen decarboxylase [Proteobacteria bacterium]|nr:uroporphyrinogen decarboxylase [Pseudomonadota bacterium]
MTTLKNDCFIRALLKQPVGRTPVWMMRQAGRYLPEYRRVREQAGSFMNLCTNPELACEVTLQPLERYRLDAAILFSDILTIPDAMGLGLHFIEGEGPRFSRPIRTEQDIHKLTLPNPEESLSYVPNAVRLIQRELQGKVPLIGFSGSPWTLATYMVEGGSSKDFRKVKTMLYDRPDLLHELLGKLADAVAAYLNAQIAAGVDVVMLFDTWGGSLTTGQYQEFSLRYAKQIHGQLKLKQAHRTLPAILFTKGGGLWLEAMAETGYAALGLDWQTPIADARRRVGDKVALQGNLDPVALYASPATIRTEVNRILTDFGHGSGHVFNLGHGVHPDIPPEHVGAMIEAVHELSPQFHV